MSKNYVKEYKGYEVPEGATHYNDDFKAFYKTIPSEGRVYFSAKENDWLWVTGSAIGFKESIEIPEEPTQGWVDGLPPVGTACEFKSTGHHDGFQWCIFQGVMSDKSYIIEYHHHTSPSRTTCGPFDPDLTTFRQLKTQEQKDREAFVEKAVEVMNNSLDDSQAGWATALFDSGFKAPEGE